MAHGPAGVRRTPLGSVRAHAAAVNLRAAVSTFPGFSEVGNILRRVHADVWWPNWWDTRPIVAHLEDTQRALRRDPIAHRQTLNRDEEMLDARRPQALCCRIAEDALRPERVLEAAGRHTLKRF